MSINSTFAVASKRGFSGSGGGGFVATGGNTVNTYSSINGTYKQHIFTSSGTFSTTGPGTVTVLIVGGGGGGGVLGGGGAGGAVIVAKGLAPTGNYTVTVGNGGTGQQGWNTAGVIARKGEPSSAFNMTAFGGGGGRSYSSGGADSENQQVGNWGGYSYSNPTTHPNGSFASMSLASGWTGNIYSGYYGGFGSTNCCPCGGGSGAGAGGNGSPSSTYGVSDGTSYTGGPGVIPTLDGVPLYGGQSVYFAGGGGPDGYCTHNGGNGGLGGGGGGGDGSPPTFPGAGGTGGINNGAPGQSVDASTGLGGNGGAGGANTGSGGGSGMNGGGSLSVFGGAGGSGIVVVRYLLA